MVVREGLIFHRCEVCGRRISGCTNVKKGEEKPNFCVNCYFLKVEGKCPYDEENESLSLHGYGECPECYAAHNHIPGKSSSRDPVLVKKEVKGEIEEIVEEDIEENDLEEGDMLSCPSGGSKSKLQF